jgi:hypothetical protein
MLRHVLAPLTVNVILWEDFWCLFLLLLGVRSFIPEFLFKVIIFFFIIFRRVWTIFIVIWFIVELPVSRGDALGAVVFLPFLVLFAGKAFIIAARTLLSSVAAPEFWVFFFFLFGFTFFLAEFRITFFPLGADFFLA